MAKRDQAAEKATRGVGRNSVGWYAEQILRGDEDSDLHQLQLDQAFAVEEGADFSVPKAMPFERSAKLENVTHRAFLTPATWGEPGYALTDVQVEPGVGSKRYLHHSGEELIFIFSGDISYEFVWPRRAAKFLPATVVAGTEEAAIRVLPNVPHYNWANQKARAWMIIRALSGSTEAIGSRSKPGSERLKAGPEDDGDGEIPNDIKEFLLLSDIPGQLALARRRAGYSVNDLATELKMHPSYIRNLELGEANLSVDTIKRIAEFVRLDLSHFRVPNYFKNEDAEPGAASALDRYQPFCMGSKTPIDESPFPNVRWRPLFDRVDNYEHWIHGHIFEMDADAKMKLASMSESEEDYLETYLGPFGKQSWIVLDGTIKYTSAKQDQKVLLTSDIDPVLHLRNKANGVLKAISRCTLLHIEHSAICTCNGPRFKPVKYKPVVNKPATQHNR